MGFFLNYEFVTHLHYSFLNVGRDHIQIDCLENSRMNRIVFPLTVDVHARIGGWVNLSSSDEF